MTRRAIAARRSMQSKEPRPGRRCAIKLVRGDLSMSTQLQAVYENGVLRPLQPLALAERQCVTITINEDASAHVDHAHFILPPDRWEAFFQLLDRPTRDIPALRELLTQPSIFDGNRKPA
jgi:Protein of unknown function DUF104